MARMLGRYELIRPLGHGGMAEVFLARRRATSGVEKRLVVKRIRRERARDPRFVSLFVQEARLSMALAHRNIVPVFDFGRAGDELFLAMELVDGPDLARVLADARQRGEAMESMLVAYIAMEACQALDYAHTMRGDDGEARALVHRDVTPRNVLLSRSGEVKLVDFGVAISADNDAPQGVRGTPAYMSPEQARGESLDGRSDLFSLGLIMWEALCGRRAYEGRDTAELLAQARAGQVPPLPAHVPEVLRRIVERATAPARDQRYDSARAMQLALDEYVLAARAASGGAPPSHALAAWVHRHGADDTAAPGWEDNLPSGRVVTFLDDGEGDVLGEADRDATMRSMADTMAEDGSTAAEPAAGEGGTTGMSEVGGTTGTSEVGGTTGTSEVGGTSGTSEVGGTSGTSEVGGTSGTSKQGGSSGSSEQAGTSRPHRRTVAIAMTALATAAVVAAWLGFVAGERSLPASTASAPAPTTPTPAPPTPALTTAPPAVAMDADVPDAHAVPDAAPPARPLASTERPAPRPRKRPVAQPAPPAATGVIKISATPWARVTVAGSDARCDETPCTLTLPAGRHVLRLENPVAGLRTERAVDVPAGDTVVVRETLTR